MAATKQPDYLAIAQKKQQLIDEFLRLTEVQAQQIEADNYDSILQLISQKQSIIEKVNCLDLEFQWIASGEDQQVKEIRAATQAILAQALELENQNIAVIKGNQAQIFAKLKNAQLNQATHAAYRGAHMAMEGILIDKKK
jgi:hypothetical protein